MNAHVKELGLNRKPSRRHNGCRRAALALGLTLSLNLGAGLAIAAETAAQGDGLGLKGFAGFPDSLRQADGENESVTLTSDLSSNSDAERSSSLTRNAGAGSWDKSTVLAAVVAGFGLSGALFLRSQAPQLGQWLSKKGLSPRAEDVNIVAVKPLGNNSSLAVVEVFDERLVLAVTAGQVSLLTRGERKLQAPPAAPAPTFGKMFGAAISGNAHLPPLDDVTDDLEPAGPPSTSHDPPQAKMMAPQETLSSVLKEALNRKRAPAAEAPTKAFAQARPAPGDGITYNRTLSSASRTPAGFATSRTADAARTPARVSAPAPPAPELGAADQVLRKIQTMRRIR